MNKQIKCLYLYVLGLFIMTSSCSTQDHNGGLKEVSSENLIIENINMPTVEVVNPQYRRFTGTSSMVGTLLPYREVKLYAMESGYVKSIYKDIGDPVRANEVIAQLKNPEIERKLQEVKAQFEVKKSIYERLKSIYDQTPDLTTIEQLEVAKANFESSKAMLDAIKDRVGFLTVRAPFSGVITERYVDNGALVQSGLSQSSARPLVDVMDISKLRLNIHVPESDVTAIIVGDSLSIIFPEIAGQKFEATISRIANALDPITKTMRIEVDIANEDLKLKPGMYAKIELTIRSGASSLSVPHPALLVEKNQFFIYKVVNSVVEKIPVRLGVQNKNFVEILDGELKADDLIIVMGKQLISPDMQVEAIKKNEDKQL